MAHIRRRAVAVIRQRFHNDRHAVGAVPLIGNGLVVIRIAVTRRFFDNALDIVVGHIGRLRLGDAVLQL